MNETKDSSRRWRTAALTLLAAGSLIIGVMIVNPATAAPFVDCNRPVYNGSVSVKVRCDAASLARVRLWVRCFSGPFVTGTKYTAWVTIPAGSYRTLAFASNGWCTSPAQTWIVDPQIAGAS